MSDNIKTAIEELKGKIQASAIAINTAEADMLDNAILEIFGIFRDIEATMNSVSGFSNMLLAANALKNQIVLDPQWDSIENVCYRFNPEEIKTIYKLRDGAELIRATALSTRKQLHILTNKG